MHRVIRSPLGKGFVAIRDNDVRAALIGLNVYQLRLIAFVMAGFLAGVSGALFAFFGRYASASYMFYHVSGEAVVWAIVGGAENGRLEVKKKIPKEELVKHMPVRFNLSTMPA
jgi:branched-chain amino acid transport system permease protein